jgi:sirohydrochlorin cobaltochelatase
VVVDIPDKAWIPAPPFPFGEAYVLLTHDLRYMRVWGPQTEDEPYRFDATPDELREWVRIDERGRYRPLPGARTMRKGWEATIATLGQDHQAVYDAVYPLAMSQRAQGSEGLRVVSLDEVLLRQTGYNKIAAELDARGRRVAANVLCGQCVKAPLWNGAAWPQGPQIVCPEPRSVMVSLCREAATWQPDPPGPSAVDPDLPFAGFDRPGNEIREAYLFERYGDAVDER